MGWESSDVVRFDLGPLLQGPSTGAHSGRVVCRLIGSVACLGLLLAVVPLLLTE